MKSRGGDLGGARVGPPEPVEMMVKKYSDLKKAFETCGITIDPPFAEAEDLPDLKLQHMQLMRPAINTGSNQMSRAPDSLSTMNYPSQPYPFESGSRSLQQHSLSHGDRSHILDEDTPLSPYSPRQHDFLPRSKLSSRILTVTVQLAPGREGRIPVQQGDSPYQLAADFVRRERLPGGEATVQRLAKLIQAKVERFVFEAGTKPEQSAGPQAKEITDPSPLKLTKTPSSRESGKPRNRSAGRTTPGRSSSRTPQYVPSSGDSNRSSRSSRVIAELEIQLGRSGRTGKLVVKQGDDARDLVNTFIKMYPGHLTQRHAEQLVNQINQRLRSVSPL